MIGAVVPSKACRALIKLRTGGIEGCRINDGRVEVISEVMPV